MNERLEIVVDQLKNDVISSNTYLESGDHAQVEKTVTKWIDIPQKLFHFPQHEKLDTASASLSDIDQLSHEEVEQFHLGKYALIAIALLGFLRIYHVDSNKQYKEGKINSETLDLRVEQIQSAYDQLPTAIQILIGIDDASIEWNLEIAQDSFRSYELLNNKPKANQILNEGIHKGVEELKTEKRLWDIGLPNKRRAGLLSVLGVLEVRKGRFVPKLLSTARGLYYQVSSNQVQYNPDRTVALGKISLDAARNDFKNGRIVQGGLRTIISGSVIAGVEIDKLIQKFNHAKN